MLFLPELSLLLAGLALFCMSLGTFRPQTTKNITSYMMLMILITTLSSLGSSGTLFYGAFEVNLFTQLMKSLVASGTLILLLFGNSDSGIRTEAQPEYYLFMLMSVLGLMMLVSSTELLAIFISLELSSFTVYLMVAMRKNDTGAGVQSEAAIKYLLYGVAASGLMLFGMSYIYGLTGTTKLAQVAPALAEIFPQPLAIIAFLLVLAGFFYKLALFPLHFWVPDVYEGAGNETTAFIATIPKLVGVALLIKITMLLTEPGQIITTVLGVCAILSMFYGNLSALVQKDLKRLLGFSGIAHAGFALLAVTLFDVAGYASAIYYISGYMLMNLACFLVVCTLAKDGHNVAIEEVTGLYKRAPLLAITLACGLFSLAGIPPFVGFMAKFTVLVGALHQGYILFVILAAINTAIALFYYLSIVRLAYCTDDEERPAVTPPWHVNLLAILLIGLIVAMGIMPGHFIDFTAGALACLG